jgi:feruloyl esterase
VFTTPPTDLRAKVLLDPQPALDAFLANFDFDRDAPKIYATSGAYSESAASFMIPPDNTHLTAYAAKQGKLIVYHGSADPVFSSNDSVRWYQELHGNVPSARDFARLFLVPGLGHCGGGPATENFDMLSAMVAWVERDVAPESVLARVNPESPNLPADWSKTRTRPLCAYPKHSVLEPGATDLESAASFACQ